MFLTGFWLISTHTWKVIFLSQGIVDVLYILHTTLCFCPSLCLFLYLWCLFFCVFIWPLLHSDGQFVPVSSVDCIAAVWTTYLKIMQKLKYDILKLETKYSKNSNYAIWYEHIYVIRFALRFRIIYTIIYSITIYLSIIYNLFNKWRQIGLLKHSEPGLIYIIYIYINPVANTSPHIS